MVCLVADLYIWIVWNINIFIILLNIYIDTAQNVNYKKQDSDWEEKVLRGQWWFLEVSVTPSDRTVSRNLFVCTSIFCLPLFFLLSSYTEYYDCLKFCHIYSQSLSDYLFARLFDLKGIRYQALTLTVKLKWLSVPLRISIIKPSSSLSVILGIKWSSSIMMWSKGM